MTSISYDDIFSYFLGGITDYQLASLDTDDAVGLMVEYLHKSVADTGVTRIFTEFGLDDELQIFKYDLEMKVNDSSDDEFTKNILAKAMVIEWLKPQVRSKLMTAQNFAGKEQKFYSQSSHLSELRALLEDTELEVDRMLTNRGFIYNAYLSES